MSPVMYALVLTTVAGAATGLGALPFLFFRKGANQRLIDGLMGFAAGIMLSATAFSLVIPSFEIGGLWPFLIGFLLGALFVDLVDHYSPHEHFLKGREGPDFKKASKIWLFVIAIAIHNFPEGMAVGVGAFSDQAESIAWAIGIQNLPEGAAVAVALINAKYKPTIAFLVAALTGAVEILGGLIGVAVLSISSALLPYMLAFAGGAMLFVISDEVIVETHANGNQRMATYCLIGGFVLMTIFDVLLG